MTWGKFKRTAVKNVAVCLLLLSFHSLAVIRTTASVRAQIDKNAACRPLDLIPTTDYNKDFPSPLIPDRQELGCRGYGLD